MATSTVDLTNLQSVNFGGGQTGFYDPSSGTVYDSGGNALSGADLAQYGAYTIGAGTSPTPPSLGSGGGPSPVNASGSGSFLSGIGGLFSTIANGMANYNRPQTISTPQGGTLVYNPATGGYTTPASLTAQSAINPLLLLLLGAVVIFLIVRSK